VKSALRGDDIYLGMKGETLQEYLLKLNEKENILLSKIVDSLVASTTNGGTLAAVDMTAPAQSPPPGPIQAFHADNLDSVLHHLRAYEASPAETNKGLRTLATLAYASASHVGNHEACVPSVLRLLALHEQDPTVVLSVMRVLCNMAYDADVARQKLSGADVLSALLTAHAAATDAEEKSACSEAAVKAGEAIARIVSVEEGSSGLRVGGKLSPLESLFLTACGCSTGVQDAIPRLIPQFVTNEVSELRPIAQAFVTASSAASSTKLALGWLDLAKALCGSQSGGELCSELVSAGAIRATAQLMERFVGDAACQLAGVEAMSSLVGKSWAGLQAFADAGGIQRMDAAMCAQTNDAPLQTKCIRGMASGITWPDEMQQKSGYNPKRGVELTLAGMQRHPDSAELQHAGCEALTKYFSTASCKTDALMKSGEELVKQAMTRHVKEQPVQDKEGHLVRPVQKMGRQALDVLGVERLWHPPAANGQTVQS